VPDSAVPTATPSTEGSSPRGDLPSGAGARTPRRLLEGAEPLGAPASRTAIAPARLPFAKTSSYSVLTLGVEAEDGTEPATAGAEKASSERIGERTCVAPIVATVPAMRHGHLIAAALAALALGAQVASPSASAVPCGSSLAAELTTTKSAAELITVVAAQPSSTVGALSLWDRARGCWRLRGGPWLARLGFNGVSAHRSEGDGTTPAGAFGIGPVIYGVAPDPGVRYRYHRVECGDWWDEDPRSRAYNRFVHLPCGAQPVFGGGSEALWLAPTPYAHFALIEYNTSPVVPGAGSAIFLHVASNSPTNGCVALPASELVTLLRWLRPVLSPLIVIGTAREIRRF
jgi:L,D-peptidoglycan transpeptidase YkuD (ErfK/YbiS/YcfS/YnhG family)